MANERRIAVLRAKLKSLRSQIVTEQSRLEKMEEEVATMQELLDLLAEALPAAPAEEETTAPDDNASAAENNTVSAEKTTMQETKFRKTILTSKTRLRNDARARPIRRLKRTKMDNGQWTVEIDGQPLGLARLTGDVLDILAQKVSDTDSSQLPICTYDHIAEKLEEHDPRGNSFTREIIHKIINRLRKRLEENTINPWYVESTPSDGRNGGAFLWWSPVESNS
jgi:hypothetical protein